MILRRTGVRYRHPLRSATKLVPSGPFSPVRLSRRLTGSAGSNMNAPPPHLFHRAANTFVQQGIVAGFVVNVGSLHSLGDQTSLGNTNMSSWSNPCLQGLEVLLGLGTSTPDLTEAERDSEAAVPRFPLTVFRRESGRRIRNA